MKKFQYNSPVILSFFLISLFTLGLDWISKGWTTAVFFSVYRSPLSDPLTYFRLFGHVLGHADLEHFFGNMLMFWVIGPPMEERYGSRSLLIGILLTALVSGILQTALFPPVLLPPLPVHCPAGSLRWRKDLPPLYSYAGEIPPVPGIRFPDLLPRLLCC